MSTDTPDLPIDAAAGRAGPHTTEAFALLADGTRLAILLALWEAYDPQADDNAVPFSAIFDRVDYDDPGNLSYHLEQLEGPFVRQADAGAGYEIRTTGLQFVRSIVAGAGVQDASLAPTELEEACPFCGAPTTISYRDGLVVHACTECAGAARSEAAVEGVLSMTPFDPAGLTDRAPAALRAASTVAAVRGARTMFDGLCPACSGPVDGWFEHCPDHDDSGPCTRCGRRTVARARFQCRICRNHKVAPAQGVALFHPAVVAFYDAHGVSTRLRADDPESVSRYYDLVDGHAVDVAAEDPLRVAVTVARDGDEVGLTFDETVRVVDVHR